MQLLMLHSGVLFTVYSAAPITKILSGADSSLETDKSVDFKTLYEATVVSQVGSRNHVKITF